MGLSATVQLNVTPLVDGEDWFVDAQAWTNYWRNLEIEAIFDSVENDKYIESPYDVNLNPAVTGGFTLATNAMFVSLLAAYNTLNTNYKEMRQVLKDAGLLKEAQ